MTYTKALLLSGLTFVEGADAITGSGWASFGVTGAILGWLLLKHLPAKDRQFKDLVSMFVDRDDRRAAEQLVWREMIVGEMRKDRHELNNGLLRVIAAVDDSEHRILAEIAKP